MVRRLLPGTCGRSMAPALAMVLLLVGCSANRAARDPAASVSILRIAAAVHEPIWSQSANALLALTDDHRIAEVWPGAPAGRAVRRVRTRLSPRFPGGGENIIASPVDDGLLYLPEPKQREVAVIGIHDLRQVATLRAGPSPSYLATDTGLDLLLSLSHTATVTTVDLHDNHAMPPRSVAAGPGAEVDGASRGSEAEYHVDSTLGIVHYKGDPLSVQATGELRLPVEDSAGDEIKPSRIYVAERGTDWLVAVDSQRNEHGLQIVGRARLPEPAQYVGVDETRIYAATADQLVVLATNSFGGYEHGTIPIIATIDFRSALRQVGLEKASISGLAVGPHRIYLTLVGKPDVITIAKPAT